jgi:hypothetical protein
MKKTGNHKNKTKKNKSIICRSIKAPCPLCNDILSGDLMFLIKHFKNIHARMPTLGEANRFRAFTKKIPGKVITQYHSLKTVGKLVVVYLA